MALKVMRDNLKHLKWTLVVVLAAMVALIFFGWGGYGDYAGVDDRVAARLGDEKITYSDFQSTYRNLERQYRQAFGEQFNNELARQLNLPMQALNQVISRRILLREAQDLGLVATDTEVRDAILSFDVFKGENGRFVGTEEYQRILRSNSWKVDEFEAQMREDLLLTKLDSVLQATVYVSDAEVEKTYREEAEKAKIRFLELPGARMGDVEVDEGALQTWLAEHPEDFEVPEKRTVDYLLVDTNKLRQEIQLTDEQMRAYYDEHQDDYTREEQVRARHILRKVTPERPEDEVRAEVLDLKRRIESGEDFATLARELSEDPGSAQNGGVLRPFGRGEMVPPFEEAAFGAAPGSLVGPVKTNFGFHLIEVQGKVEGGTQPFEEAQPSIRARLLTEEANRLAETKALDLAGRIPEGAGEAELRTLAEEEGLKLETTEPFGQEDAIPGLGAPRTFNTTVFGLEEGKVSEPLRIPRGWIIARLREVVPPRQPELSEVEDAVRQAVVRERQKEAAALELRAVAEKGLDALAGELGIEVQESAEFGKNGTLAGLGRNREVIDTALESDVGAIGGPFPTEQGAVVFEVVERQTFDPEKFAEQAEATRTQKEEELLQGLRASILEKRRLDLGVSYDPSLAENFGITLPGAEG